MQTTRQSNNPRIKQNYTTTEKQQSTRPRQNPKRDIYKCQPNNQRNLSMTESTSHLHSSSIFMFMFFYLILLIMFPCGGPLMGCRCVSSAGGRSCLCSCGVVGSQRLWWESFLWLLWPSRITCTVLRYHYLSH